MRIGLGALAEDEHIRHVPHFVEKGRIVLVDEIERI